MKELKLVPKREFQITILEGKAMFVDKQKTAVTKDIEIGTDFGIAFNVLI